MPTAINPIASNWRLDGSGTLTGLLPQQQRSLSSQPHSNTAASSAMSLALRIALNLDFFRCDLNNGFTFDMHNRHRLIPAINMPGIAFDVDRPILDILNKHPCTVPINDIPSVAGMHRFTRSRHM